MTEQDLSDLLLSFVKFKTLNSLDGKPFFFNNFTKLSDLRQITGHKRCFHGTYILWEDCFCLFCLLLDSLKYNLENPEPKNWGNYIKVIRKSAQT